MKCLILAAGYATRLYPLTENFPKPLLTVGEKTILDWLVDDIDTARVVDEFVVISNHNQRPGKVWFDGLVIENVYACKSDTPLTPECHIKWEAWADEDAFLYFGTEPSIIRPPNAITFPATSIIGNITLLRKAS